MTGVIQNVLYWRRYGGIAMVAILWSTTLINVYLVELNLFGNNPLSYLGTDDRSAFLFSFGLISAALALLLFAQYLKDVFVITKSFLIALYVGQIGQIIAALVHFGGEQPDRTIHTVAALTLAFSIPIALWRFATAQKSSRVRRIAYALFWLELTGFIIGIGLFSFVINGAPIGQIMPAIGFHAWILYFSLYPANMHNQQ